MSTLVCIMLNMVEWQQISVELFKVKSLSPRTPSVCHAASVRACMCDTCVSWVQVWSAVHQTFRSAVSPGCHFSTSGLGVSMCNNDYLHLNHKEQENLDNCNTVGNPPLPCLDPDEIWRQDLLSSALLWLKTGTHNNLWELRSSLC